MAKRQPHFTADRLRELLAYDGTTGHFIWLVSKGRAPKGHRAGTWTSTGYRQIRVLGTIYFEHRLAWYWTTGKWPSEIDHINRNKGDNRLENLREVTRRQNARNTTRHNRTGVKGVYFDAKANRYYAQIALGGYPTIEEATEVRKAAEQLLHEILSRP